MSFTLNLVKGMRICIAFDTMDNLLKNFFCKTKNPVLGIYCFPVQRLTLYAQSSEQYILLLAIAQTKTRHFSNYEQ